MTNYVQLALLTPSQPNKRVQKSFKVRLFLALLVLIIQIATLVPTIHTSLAAINIFKAPVLVACLACFFSPKFLGTQAQKIVKILLKVSIAKTFGSILLAVYISLKYYSGSYQSTSMRLCAIYFTVSAVGDIISSLMVYFAIKKTRSIIRGLRRVEKKSQKTFLESINSSPSLSDNSECSSATLSDRSSRLGL